MKTSVVTVDADTKRKLEAMPLELTAKRLLGCSILDRDKFLEVLEKLCQVMELTAGIHCMVQQDIVGVDLTVCAFETPVKKKGASA